MNDSRDRFKLKNILLRETDLRQKAHQETKSEHYKEAYTFLTSL